MDDTGLMRGTQAGHDAPQHGQRPRRRQARLAREDRRQVAALDVRHRDVLDAIHLAEVVDADNVVVGDLPRQEQLALEAALDLPGEVRVARDLRPDDLEGDRDRKLGVPRLIDDAHPAGAQHANDVVAGAKWLARDDEPVGRLRGPQPRSTGTDRPRRAGSRHCPGLRVGPQPCLVLCRRNPRPRLGVRGREVQPGLAVRRGRDPCLGGAGGNVDLGIRTIVREARHPVAAGTAMGSAEAGRSLRRGHRGYGRDVFRGAGGVGRLAEGATACRRAHLHAALSAKHVQWGPLGRESLCVPGIMTRTEAHHNAPR